MPLPGVRLFRNNTGAFKQGNRFVRYGLCPGSADIIGWKMEDAFLPDPDGAMLPTRMCSFVAIECKDLAWREPSPPGPRASKSTRQKWLAWQAQRQFLEDVRAAGGLAGIARSVEDALGILQGLTPPGADPSAE